MNAKERFLSACLQKPVDRPPVWMMRQAGRYLPEYRTIRKKMSTLQMMKSPDTACEITLQPISIVGVDAAILYSDILMVPEAMGLKLDFVPQVGPVFENPIRSAADVEALNATDIPTRCSFVYETLKKIRKSVGPDFPVLGFAGSPFTVATYMVGGDGSHEAERLKKLAFQEKRIFRSLMEKITLATIDYLRKQINAGADALQLFDTWAGTLSPEQYDAWALPYTREIFKALKPLDAPLILYIKGGSHLFEKMIGSGANVISVDWRLPLSKAREISQDRVALQGNLDPLALYSSPETIYEEVKKMFTDRGPGPGYIANLGHGILPDIPVENAKAFIQAAKEVGKQATNLNR